MSFHAGGHKPKFVQPAQFRIKQRLFVLGCGTVLALVGMFKLNNGQLEWRNYLGEPMYSPSLVILGVIFGIFALIPQSWLDRTGKWLNGRSRNT